MVLNKIISDDVTLVYFDNSKLLESPVFDSENQLLYFVSIYGEKVYCYDIINKNIFHFSTNGPVGCVQIIGYKRVITAELGGIFLCDFNLSTRTFLNNNIDKLTVRYNDGILDSKGRFIIGTMGYPDVINDLGKVYSYFNNTFKTIISNTTISNGLGFSSDSKYLYFIDTPTNKVARYLYSIDTGDVQFDKYIIEITGEGSPDGMCVDNEGFIWIAEWGGGNVSKWDSDNGNLIERIKIPCSNITSCCFDSKRNLYVTSAKNEGHDEEYGGGLFYINLKNKLK